MATKQLSAQQEAAELSEMRSAPKFAHAICNAVRSSGIAPGGMLRALVLIDEFQTRLRAPDGISAFGDYDRNQWLMWCTAYREAAKDAGDVIYSLKRLHEARIAKVRSHAQAMVDQFEEFEELDK